MSREQDLPLVTAYALGELHGPEKLRIENLIRNDPALQQAVKEIKQTAGLLAMDLKSPSNNLSSTDKNKVEQGWKDLAAKESRSRLYRRILGAVSALAAAVFAFAIVRPNVAQFSQSKLQPREEAQLAAPAPAQKDIADSERTATVVKIEKKEVNAEIGTNFPADEKADSTKGDEGYGIGGGGISSPPMLAQKMAPTSKSLGKGVSAPRPVSVLFGGDGEVVSGVPDNKSVKEKLREKTSELTACYLRVLEDQPGTKGKLILQWGIIKGRASGITTTSSTLGNGSLEKCVVSTVKGVQFGAENNGAIVVMPFHFMSQN
jgi:hypothetical protein